MIDIVIMMRNKITHRFYFSFQINNLLHIHTPKHFALRYTRHIWLIYNDVVHLLYMHWTALFTRIERHQFACCYSSPTIHRYGNTHSIVTESSHIQNYSVELRMTVCFYEYTNCRSVQRMVKLYYFCTSLYIAGFILQSLAVCLMQYHFTVVLECHHSHSGGCSSTYNNNNTTTRHHSISNSSWKILCFTVLHHQRGKGIIPLKTAMLDGNIVKII